MRARRRPLRDAASRQGSADQRAGGPNRAMAISPYQVFMRTLSILSSTCTRLVCWCSRGEKETIVETWHRLHHDRLDRRPTAWNADGGTGAEGGHHATDARSTSSPSLCCAPPPRPHAARVAHGLSPLLCFWSLAGAPPRARRPPSRAKLLRSLSAWPAQGRAWTSPRTPNVAQARPRPRGIRGVCE